ncbi:type II toxin-antitoxin system Phd/YefM family antitoxin [Sandarakinorhabdus sp.]|uniref:type II toxin-antitoxin system Phd/YefM family antitoxin n=1 Tax=Sandarakinorhabdus sp. TaxID=1916663 RepID=UPI003F6F92A0
MSTINIHDAKTHLSRLIGDVEQGASFTIARAGKPAARLVPIKAVARTGFLVGHFQVPEDFDSMGAAEIADMFEGAR